MPAGRDLSALVRPQTIAVVGASRDPGKVGHAIFRNILAGGFAGTVHPVNPQARSINGVRAYPSVLEVPDPVDLAVVITPARTVPAVLDECGQRGVRGVVVISGGFREIGEEGRRREAEVCARVARWGFALVGPNCLGVINTAPDVRLNATFAARLPHRGQIAFVSQSGALTAAALDYAWTRRIGFSQVFNLGNKADLTEVELLGALADDPDTRVILLYVEELSDGRRFIEVAREIGDGHPPKPIMVLKAGRTAAGARAVSSHTGSLAGSDEVYGAVFAQAGVLRVESIEELFDCAAAFASQPLPRGRRVGIVTNAGGPGILATDACVRQGLELASLSDATVAELRRALPAEASVRNPVDIIGDADDRRYDAALAAVLADDAVDAGIVLLTRQATIDVEATAAAVVQRAAASGKPVLASFVGALPVDAGVDRLEEAGLPHYAFPEAIARTLAAMARYTSWIARPRTEVVTFDDVDRARARAILTAAPEGFLSETAAFELLEAYRFPLLPWAAATDARAAEARASAIGFPVALKVLSPEVIHKVDVDGVRLNLASAAEVSRAYEEIVRAVAARVPGAAIHGVLVQAMAGRGREVILGLSRDPQFGPVLLFGLGGIYVEVLRDVAFRLAPIRAYSARRMVEETRTSAILRGVRGEPPSDVAAIETCLLRLSQLAVECPEVAELDINPLFVYAAGGGAAVADARVRVARPAG
ncbi:MAG: acetate--CoA ligase family protein [Armatimonadota bacterium]|nr:acetate--CoA ligase family protein [Armatimonadota bacterium]MDR7423323.1 acetate--CoA ligase family protein [Armatimonadota bacterium]MDR7457054.1 acetate--CoA ligase family protein [Armatimonadota bacterium]MDR7511932.1 acetate--CoA ligase family protein [Armatimonadota bacterium]